MEQDGWIRSEWGITEKNRKARFYALTTKGRKQLANEEAGWSRLASGVGEYSAIPDMPWDCIAACGTSSGQRSRAKNFMTGAANSWIVPYCGCCVYPLRWITV